MDSNDIYAINVNRARYREKMDAGNWSLNLSGSKGLFTFIDGADPETRQDKTRFYLTQAHQGATREIQCTI